MLRSFNSLAFRQLRTRKLRSALTAFGVVLGVGMVFGVLLLVGTIRATFDEVIDSAWGQTDLIVRPSRWTAATTRRRFATGQSSVPITLGVSCQVSAMITTVSTTDAATSRMLNCDGSPARQRHSHRRP